MFLHYRCRQEILFLPKFIIGNDSKSGGIETQGNHEGKCLNVCVEDADKGSVKLCCGFPRIALCNWMVLPTSGCWVLVPCLFCQKSFLNAPWHPSEALTRNSSGSIPTLCVIP